jgi:hypothetical protein
MSEAKSVCTNWHVFANAMPVGKHEAVLQVLNRWMVYGQDRLFYAVKNFVGTEEAWNSVPLVYAQEHPDPNLIERNLQAALNAIKANDGGPGRICGHLSDTAVQIAGQPRLESKVVFTDQALERAYQAGELSLSTCFFTRNAEDGSLIGKVRPNHVLVFRPDSTIQPRDAGAMLMHATRSEASVTEDDKSLANAGRVISTANASKLKQAINSIITIFKEMSGEDPVSDEPAAADVAKAAKIVAQSNAKQEEMADQKLSDELVAANAKIVELEKKATEAAEAAKVANDRLVLANAELKKISDARVESEWLELKNSQIPKGWLKGEGKEAELRKEFETDKAGLLLRILEHTKSGSDGGSGEEGTAHAHANSGGSDHLSAIRDLHAASGRVR